VQIHLHIDHAAQADRDRGRVDVPHVRIRDHGNIGAQRLAMSGDKGCEITAADLLLPLDQHGDAAWERTVLALPCPERAEPHHHLPLIVDRTARDDSATVRPLDDCRLKRGRRPQIERVRRLHVVVTVVQQMRSASG
jgi:hypothetical protein